MKVLLTGAGGMVGRNILEHAAASRQIWLTPTRATLDLGDREAVLRYVDKQQPDLIIHAAGKVGGIQANIQEPVQFLVTNLDIGVNVILAAAQTGIPKLINLGSSCMYPRNRNDSLRETDILSGPLEPTNEGYALAKIAAARLAAYVCCEHTGLAYKTMIPCNLYGKYDHFEPNRSHLIAAVIHKLHSAVENGLNEVAIWGDGKARREFLYACDLADAIFFAMDNYETAPEIVNIGTGHDHSVDEFYSAVAEVVGYTGKFTHDLSKPAGMHRKLLNVERAREWGWDATTSLREGIAATYRHYLEKRETIYK